jgi:hypothetical protein
MDLILLVILLFGGSIQDGRTHSGSGASLSQIPSTADSGWLGT